MTSKDLNQQDRTVIAMKWGTLYSADYVNVLFNACTANLTGPFRFVCFTDHAEGIAPGVEVFPIPEIGLTQENFTRGAWPKLTVFLAHQGILRGRCLFIDLDTVILDNIDVLFEMPGDLVCIDSGPWRRKAFRKQIRTMTSFFGFDAGNLSWIVERFRQNAENYIKRYDNEQNFLHGEVPDIAYWPPEWVVSFKYHVRQPIIVDRFRSPIRPRAPARILVFHGRPRPIDLIVPPPGNWDLFPHYGSGKVDWMVEYWNQYLS